MAKNSNHVVPALKGGWTVRKHGSEQASRRFDRKSEAIEWARGQSKTHGSDLVIHGKDGMIREVHSYGRDLVPPRDRH